MTISNTLIILRDQHNYTQQQVAEALGVSKSTYCRYEQGKTTLGVEEINAILTLYGITYEEFVGIRFPIEHTIKYPTKLLDLLEKTINENSEPAKEYAENNDKYHKIKEAMAPILSIRDEGLSFPGLDLTNIPSGTVVKSVNMDARGERLISRALKAQDKLWDAMMG
ncbi:helix-turn-helix transcriptional regulator [Butyrivibrio sp. AC2005]|uniref:helix-turn-helix transcriptional regulator n=1 Tax=Butyrivibrio sp. AC2005 TaxID=1280672 RepID=UPI0003FF6428|nr:helix-turn-helix transcriptional regulator [Butyrivibrio sp. AC2005]